MPGTVQFINSKLRECSLEVRLRNYIIATNNQTVRCQSNDLLNLPTFKTKTIDNNKHTKI